MPQGVEIRVVVSMPFEENTYILWKPPSARCIVVDPGLEPEAMLEEIANEGLEVAAILNTHGHADHIAGNEAIKHAFPNAPLIIGKKEAAMLADPQANLSAPFGFPIVSPEADQQVVESELVEIEGLRFEVFEIPGHSPGHVVFFDREHGYVLGGDVLFAGSIGRTDFPGGDFRTLETGIRKKLYTLPDATLVYSGHGDVTTIGKEKKTNPFVRE